MGFAGSVGAWHISGCQETSLRDAVGQLLHTMRGYGNTENSNHRLGEMIRIDSIRKKL